MLDATPISHQRSRGDAAVALATDGSGTRLMRLRQAGSAKAMLPRVHGPVPEVVFLNTAGGLTGGDRFSFSLDLVPKAQAIAATQTAERVYASSGGRAKVTVDLSVGDAAHLAWLPQDTILFDQSGLERHTTIRLAPGASVLSCETLVLGRTAMGETLEDVDVIDIRRIETSEGRPIFHEAIRLTAQDLRDPSNPAGLAGARALATLILAGPGAGDKIEPARAALGSGAGAAASVAGEALVIRLMDADAHVLRRRLAKLITTLSNHALPRVWQI